MNPPSPHLCTIKRLPFTDRETIEAEITISTENPCFFTPADVGTSYTFMGRAEKVDDLIFLEYDVDVQLGDKIINDDTNEEWYVIKPASKFLNPTTMEPDHIQLAISRNPIQ